MEGERYGRTSKGDQEISSSKRTLPAKLRTVLFLIDAGKDIGEIQRQILSIGGPADALAQLVNGGYVAPIASGNQSTTSLRSSASRGRS